MADGVRETTVKVRSLQASIGPVKAPPTAGQFSLHYASGAAVGPFDFSITDDALKAALLTAHTAGTLPYTCLEVRAPVAGCWVLRFDHDAAFAMEPVLNTLEPESFVRWRGYEESGTWWHELRLEQTPLAFTDQYERILPPAPVVTRVHAGVPKSGSAGDQ